MAGAVGWAGEGAKPRRGERKQALEIRGLLSPLRGLARWPVYPRLVPWATCLRASGAVWKGLRVILLPSVEGNFRLGKWAECRRLNVCFHQADWSIVGIDPFTKAVVRPRCARPCSLICLSHFPSRWDGEVRTRNEAAHSDGPTGRKRVGGQSSARRGVGNALGSLEARTE